MKVIHAAKKVAALEEANAAALAQTREALTVQHEQAQASALVALQRVQQVAQNAFSDFDDASFEGDAADAFIICHSDDIRHMFFQFPLARSERWMSS